MQWREGKFEWGDFCLGSNGSVVCNQLSLNEGGFAVTGRMQRVPLTMLKAYLPKDALLSGVVDADYQIETA